MPMCKEVTCLYDAPDWRSWVIHARTHGKIPCTEDECYSAFSRESNFKRHLKTTHEDTVKYKCSACPKLYARKDSAARHVAHCPVGGVLTTVGVGGEIVFPVTVVVNDCLVTVPITVSAINFMVPGSSHASVSGVPVVTTSVVTPVVSTREVPLSVAGASVMVGAAAVDVPAADVLVPVSDVGALASGGGDALVTDNPGPLSVAAISVAEMSDAQLVTALEPGRMERLVDMFVRQCLAVGDDERVRALDSALQTARVTFSVPRVPAPVLDPIGGDDLSALEGDLYVSSSEDAA